MTQLPLSKIFSILDARLTSLEFLTDVINYETGVPVPNYSIKEIETQIFNYTPKDAIKYVDKSLEHISNLKKEGFKIVSAVIVEKQINRFKEKELASSVEKKEILDELYENISTELSFYEVKLNILKEALQFNSVLDKSTLTGIKKSTHKIPPEELALDIRQSALLFNYLREKKIIQDLPNDKLATCISILTGFESKVRTTKGLGVISKIKSDAIVSKRKKGDTPYYNLKSVKNVLSKIIDEINNEISSLSKQKK